MSILQWRTGNKLYKNALMLNKAAHYNTERADANYASPDTEKDYIAKLSNDIKIIKKLRTVKFTSPNLEVPEDKRYKTPYEKNRKTRMSKNVEDVNDLMLDVRSLIAGTTQSLDETKYKIQKGQQVIQKILSDSSSDLNNILPTQYDIPAQGDIMKMIKALKNNRAGATAVDFETIGDDLIVEYGFVSTDTSIQEWKKERHTAQELVTKKDDGAKAEQIKRLIGFQTDEQKQLASDIIKDFKNARTNYAVMKSSDKYIIKYMAMLGYASKHGWIDEEKGAIKQFLDRRQYNNIDINDLDEGFELLKRMGLKSLNETKRFNGVEMRKHEAEMLQQLSDTMTRGKLLVTQNGLSFDLPTLHRMFTGDGVSANAREEYIKMTSKHNLLDYENNVDLMVVDRFTSDNAIVSGDTEAAKQMALNPGETYGTNTIHRLRQGIPDANLGVAHTALEDAANTLNVLYADSKMHDALEAYYNNNKGSKKPTLKIGTILTSTQGDLTSKYSNGYGTLGFTYDPVMGQTRFISKYNNQAIVDDEYKTFADTFKKGTSFAISSFNKINLDILGEEQRNNLLKQMTDIDPGAIGKDLYVLELQQLQRGGIGKAQSHYLVGSARSLMSMMQSFDVTGQIKKKGAVDRDAVIEYASDINNAKLGIEINTDDVEDRIKNKYKSAFIEKGELKNGEYSAQTVIKAGIDILEKDSAISSFNRNAYGMITKALNFNKRIEEVEKEKKKTKEDIISTLSNIQSEEAIKMLEELGKETFSTQNSLSNHLQLMKVINNNNASDLFQKFVGIIDSSSGGEALSATHKNASMKKLFDIFGDVVADTLNYKNKTLDKKVKNNVLVDDNIFTLDLSFLNNTHASKRVNNVRNNGKDLVDVDLSKKSRPYNLLSAMSKYTLSDNDEKNARELYYAIAQKYGFIDKESGKVYDPKSIRERMETLKMNLSKEGIENIKTVKDLAAVVGIINEQGLFKIEPLETIDLNSSSIAKSKDTLLAGIAEMLNITRALNPELGRERDYTTDTLAKEEALALFQRADEGQKQKILERTKNEFNAYAAQEKGWITYTDSNGHMHAQNSIQDIVNEVVDNTLIGGFGDVNFQNKDETVRKDLIGFLEKKGLSQENAEKEADKIIRNRKSIISTAKSVLSPMSGYNTHAVSIEVNRNTQQSILHIGEHEIELSRVLPALHYSDKSKGGVLSLNGSAFLNPEVISEVGFGEKSRLTLTDHITASLNKISGIFTGYAKDANNVLTDKEYFQRQAFGFKELDELLRVRAANKFSGEDFINQNNVIYEDFVHKLGFMIQSGYINGTGLNKEVQEAFEGIREALDQGYSISAIQERALVKHRIDILNKILESEDLTNMMFSSEKEAKRIKSMLINAVYGTKDDKKAEGELTAHVASTISDAMSSYGSKDTRYVDSVIHRALEIDTEKYKRIYSNTGNLSFGTGIYEKATLKDNIEEAIKKSESISVRSVALEMSTEKLNKIITSNDFANFLKSSNIEGTQINKVVSVLSKVTESNSSLTNPKFMALMSDITLQTIQERDIIDVDRLKELLGDTNKRLVKMAEKQAEATGFVLKLAAAQNDNVFSYGTGMIVKEKDIIGLKMSYTGQIEKERARRTALLKGRFFDADTKQIVSQDRINQIIQDNGIVDKIKYEVEKNRVAGKIESESEILIRILAGSDYNLQYRRFTMSAVENMARKLVLSGEKSYSEFAGSTMGYLDNRVNDLLKASGLGKLRYSNMSEEILETLSSGNSKTNMMFQLSGRKNFNQFQNEFLEQYNSIFGKAETTFSTAAKNFIEAVRGERNLAWNLLEEYFRDNGRLRQDEVLGHISGTIYDRSKHNGVNYSVEMVANTKINQLMDNDRTLTRVSAAEQVAKEINQKWYGNNTVASVDDHGNIIFTDKDKYDLNADAFKETSQEVMKASVDDGIAKIVVSTTQANDPIEAGFKGDSIDKGVKWHTRSYTVLAQHTYDQDNIKAAYEALQRTGVDDVDKLFNRRFKGIAKVENDKIVIEEGALGKQINEETIKYFNEQLTTRGYNYDDVVSIDEKGIIQVEKGRTDRMLTKADKQIEDLFSEDKVAYLKKNGVSQKMIELLKDAYAEEGVATRNISMRYALSNVSAATFLQSGKLNRALISSEVDGYGSEGIRSYVNDFAKERGFNVVTLSDLSVDPAGNEGDMTSMFKNPLVIDFNGEHGGNGLKDSQGRGFFSFGWLGHELEKQMDSEPVSKLQNTIRSMKRIAEEYYSATTSKDEKQKLASKFTQLADQAFEMHDILTKTKESIVNEQMASVRLEVSFNAKGGTSRAYKGDVIIAEKFTSAKIDGKSLAERASMGIDDSFAFISSENFMRLMGGEDHVKTMYQAVTGKDDFDIDNFIEYVNEHGGMLGLAKRNPENYPLSIANTRVFIDKAMSSNKVDISEILAVGMHLDVDGDLSGIMAVVEDTKVTLNDNQTANLAMTSALKNYLNSVKENSVVSDGKRFNEIERGIMLQEKGTLASAKSVIDENSRKYMADADMYYSKFESVLKKQIIDGTLVNRNVYKNYGENGREYLNNVFNEIVKSDQFKASFDKVKTQENIDLSKVSDDFSNMTSEQLQAVANQYLTDVGDDLTLDSYNSKTNPGRDIRQTAKDALMDHWTLTNESDDYILMQQQARTGLINMNTYRGRVLLNQMIEYANNNNMRKATEEDRNIVSALFVHMDEDFQAAKHGNVSDASKFGEEIKRLFGVWTEESANDRKIDIEGFLNYLDKDYGLFGGDKGTVTFKDASEAFQVAGGKRGVSYERMKQALENIMSPAIDNGLVVSGKYFSQAAQEWVRKGVNGEWSGMYFDKTLAGELLKNSPDAMAIQDIRALSGGDSLFEAVDFLEKPYVKQEYESNAEKIDRRQQRYAGDLLDFQNIDDKLIRDYKEEFDSSPSSMIESAGTSIKNLASKHLSGGKGAIALGIGFAAAGILGGNPTSRSNAPAPGGEAQQESGGYDIPDMSYPTQIQQQAPGGYVINVNASSGQGRRFLSQIMNKAFGMVAPGQNVNMTMNINDDSSNIGFRDVVQYLKDAI